jgi:hypothetical protein
VKVAVFSLVEVPPKAPVSRTRPRIRNSRFKAQTEGAIACSRKRWESQLRIRGNALPARRGGLGWFQSGKRNFNFFEMSGQKIFRKKRQANLTTDNNMNIVADDPISETHEFTNQSVLFPIGSGRENPGERPTSRLSREQIDAFLNAEFDNARSAHFSVPPAEPAAAADKSLAAGVLKQAARDLRRFRSATRGLKQELYLDAYSWIMVDDFSWPYSFVNVCRLLDVCPEVIRAELLADASLGWFDYWTRRAGRLYRRLQSATAKSAVVLINERFAI